MDLGSFLVAPACHFEGHDSAMANKKSKSKKSGAHKSAIRKFFGSRRKKQISYGAVLKFFLNLKISCSTIKLYIKRSGPKLYEKVYL